MSEMNLRLRLRGELRKVPEDRIFDRAVDVEPPALARNVRRQAEIERRPVPGQMLARRQALLFGPRDLAGEEVALARPALPCCASACCPAAARSRRPCRTSSFVAMHRGFMLGVAHRRIDDQRQEDHAAEIVVEPVLVAERLELERDRRRGAAEDRDRDRIGQADAERADLGREQLGLHDGVDRGVAGDDQPGAADQQEGRERRSWSPAAWSGSESSPACR